MSKLTQQQQSINELPARHLEWVIDHLNGLMAIGRDTVRYNEKEQYLEAVYELSLVGLFNRRIPVNDKHLSEALAALDNQIRKEYQQDELIYQLNELNYKYGEAVMYFHNDVEIDRKGIYKRLGFGRKQYFTLYELDQMKEQYEAIA